jgi:prophage maintenance system killer protein
MDGQMAEAFLSHLATYGNLSATTQNQALSATYGVGLAKNHAFVDGQKIAAFLSIGLFLGLNGYKLKATQVDATLTMLAVAAGETDAQNFTGWIRKKCCVKITCECLFLRLVSAGFLYNHLTYS